MSSKVGIPDEKGQGNFSQSAADTQFIAVHNNTKEVPGMEATLLMRYKFVEILARIAQQKFTN